MEPDTIPLMMCFCPIIKPTIIGNAAISTAVIIKSHCLTKEPANARIANGIV